ncbi:MAG: methyl-accepting chemotaxis protein [Halorientalis sp.]
MSQASGIKRGHRRKLGLGALVIVALVVVAAINTYARTVGSLDPEAQSELLSGLATIVIAVVATVFLIIAVTGRETVMALTILSERAREREEGDAAVDVDTEGREMGELYESYEAVRNALQERIRESEDKSEQLRAAASDYSDTMELVGQGDLSQRLDEDVEDPVMAQLAGDFNDMMDQLEAAIADLYAFTEDVSQASQLLAQQTAQSMEASMRIREVAQDITEDGQMAETFQQFEQFEDLDIDLQHPDEIEDGELGIELDETVGSIEDLSDRMDRIDEISEFISDVANETNMLALNAGIEASKVDDDSAEGFQVVADEVKSLAEETEDSANEIESSTEDIRSGTREALESVLRQQAELLSTLSEQVEDLSDSSEDLQQTLSRLHLSQERDPEADAESEPNRPAAE